MTGASCSARAFCYDRLDDLLKRGRSSSSSSSLGSVLPLALAGGHRVTAPLLAKYDATACAICCLIFASLICFATFRDDRSSIAPSSESPDWRRHYLFDWRAVRRGWHNRLIGPLQQL
jgi:hypothetical protein